MPKHSLTTRLIVLAFPLFILLAEPARSRPVPPLSVQTLVEKAVNYGVAHFREPREITLAVSLDAADGALRVQVGNGSTTADEVPPPATSSSGVGLRNLCERLRRLAGERAAVRFDRLAGGQVRVAMILPQVENAGAFPSENLVPAAMPAQEAIP